MPKKVTKDKKIASISKFKNNPFAKKYKEELSDEGTTRDKVTFFPDEFYAADQVKSWKRSPISQTVNLRLVFLAFIIGFSLCAVVMTPLVVSSI